jgi:predicted dehydrogenase
MTAASTRVGIVGAGIAAQLHARSLAEFPDVTIAAVCDPDRQRARALADRVGGAVHASAEAMFDAVALDAVYICVPPFVHGPPEYAALARGVPFYVEKPLAADRGTARAIAARVATAGVPTQVGHQWRYRGYVPEARALLADRPAALVLARWLADIPSAAWWSDEQLSGGQVVEQTVHLLDLVRWLVGEVTEVQAAAVRRPQSDGLADLTAASCALLRFASGAVGSVASTCMLDRASSSEVRLVADGLSIEIGARAMVVERAGDTVRREDTGSAMARADRAFIDAVRGGRADLRSPYADALRSHELALAVAESTRTGLPVRV